MGVPVTPRRGNQSAPSDAPAPQSVAVKRGPKSAPTDAPAVRSTQTPSTNGDQFTPSSVKSNIKDQKAPTPGSKDPAIERIA